MASSKTKITPSYSEFLSLSRKGNLIPVYMEVLPDLHTPFSLIQRFKKESYFFLLESITGGEHIARYSFIGLNPAQIIKSRNGEIFIWREGRSENKKIEQNPLEAIKEELARYRYVKLKELPRFSGGFVGYISYEMVRYFEELPDENPDQLNLYSLFFMEARDLYIFDHIRQRLILLTHVYLDEAEISASYRRAVNRLEQMLEKLRMRMVQALPSLVPKQIVEGTVRSNFKKEKFLKAVIRAKKYIREGDIIQVVLSQRFEREQRANESEIYRWLRFINPSPYMFYLKCNDHSLIGSSPEVFVRCEDGLAELRPIAGTRRRGRDEEEDGYLEKELLEDKKERAEHVMLVDLGRNDLGRVCKYGSIEVKELMVIEKYSHVMHIVSDVVGIMKKGKDLFDLIQATFPAGTVSGAPKIRAMEIIDELEPSKRGPYAGCVAYFSYSGNMDSCITIRTIVSKDKKLYIQAGAGIVADSIPEREYRETINKAKALNRAIDLAEQVK